VSKESLIILFCLAFKKSISACKALILGVRNFPLTELTTSMMDAILCIRQYVVPSDWLYKFPP